MNYFCSIYYVFVLILAVVTILPSIMIAIPILLYHTAKPSKIEV